MLHISGFFILPGLQNGDLSPVLEQAQGYKIFTSLDVVESPGMKDPAILWPCLPYLDLLFCNVKEAWLLTGERKVARATQVLRQRGVKAVVIKLGKMGCWLETEAGSERLPGQPAVVVDTTGAGDAFDAGVLAALLRGAGWQAACQTGNAAGRRMVGILGAVEGWQERANKG